MDNTSDPGSELGGSSGSSGSGSSQVQASTGANDPNSVWGSGLLTTAEGLASTFGKVYQSVTGSGSSPASAGAGGAAFSGGGAGASSAAGASSSLSKYLPYIIGGVVLVAVLLFFTRRS